MASLMATAPDTGDNNGHDCDDDDDNIDDNFMIRFGNGRGIQEDYDDADNHIDTDDNEITDDTGNDHNCNLLNRCGTGWKHPGSQ